MHQEEAEIIRFDKEKGERNAEGERKEKPTTLVKHLLPKAKMVNAELTL